MLAMLANTAYIGILVDVHISCCAHSPALSFLFECNRTCGMGVDGALNNSDLKERRYPAFTMLLRSPTV